MPSRSPWKTRLPPVESTLPIGGECELRVPLPPPPPRVRPPRNPQGAAARDPRTDELGLPDLTRRVAANELAGLRVDALHPVVDVVHRPHIFDLAVRAVVHEHEAALVLVDEQLLAVAVQHEALTETGIVVPVVVRNLL